MCQDFLVKKDSDGNRVPCPYSAKWYNPLKNKYVCGRHADSTDKVDDNLLHNVKPKSTRINRGAASAGPLDKTPAETWHGIVLAAISSNDPGLNLTDDQLRAIKDLPTLEDKTQFESVISTAYSFSGSTAKMVNGVGIANNISECIDGYRQAKYQKRIDIPKNFVHFPSRSSQFVIDFDKRTTKYPSLYYPKADIRIINCRGIEDLGVWMQDPKNIYMGPKHNIIFDDSPWFYPLPLGEKLRCSHNLIKIKEILKNIEDGKEDKEKYMALRGKTLGCLCLPSACHCEVYLNVVKSLLSKN